MNAIAVDQGSARLAPLLEMLGGGLQHTAQTAATRMIAELGSYRDHDAEELLPVVEGNLRASLADIAGAGQSPLERDLMHRDTGRTRALQGVSVEDMLHGWRIGVQELLRSARDCAAGCAIPDSVVLEFTELALAWADHGMLASAKAHRLVELDLARHEQHARANVVRSVLMGTPAASELTLQAMAYSLDPGAMYVPFRARVSDGLDIRTAERQLGVADGAGPRRGLAALIDGDLAGFSSRLPTALPDSPRLVVGVGTSGPLDGLAQPFLLATRALSAALLLGRQGLTAFDDLGLHPAVLEDDDVAGVLIGEIVAPLLRHGNSGQTVLHTVARYLANDRQLTQTAAELQTHVNTIRNRLRRFEELTGRELKRTGDLVETWWVLERLASGASRGPKGDADRPEIFTTTGARST